MIVIHDKEITAYRATVELGSWTAVSGSRVEIENFEFSFAPINDEKGICILVSELTSGAQMFKDYISYEEFMMTDTREKAHELYRKTAEMVQLKIKINGVEKVRKAIKETKDLTEKALGKMPEIVECDFFEEAHK